MTDTHAIVAADADIVASLRQAFHRRWNFGSNALVGWSWSDDAMQVLFAPTLKVLGLAAAHPRVIHGGRRMGPRTFAEIAELLEVTPERVTLQDGSTSDVDAIAEDVDALAVQYAITKTRYRAAFLLDIAGFSLFSPEEQAAQLTTLDYSLNIAEETCARFGLVTDLARSTTGDGYYVWNREKGLRADVNLFCVLMIALAHHSLQVRTVKQSYVPTIRTCFGFGSHYSFHQHSRRDPVGHDYIVGDVTIHLARLIQHARPNQILVSESVEVSGPDDVEADAFFDRVAETLAQCHDMTLAGIQVARIAAYLTGEAGEGGAFLRRRLTFEDKHGFSHAGYNAKVNIFLEGGEPVYLGLQDDDLQDDSAESVKADSTG